MRRGCRRIPGSCRTLPRSAQCARSSASPISWTPVRRRGRFRSMWPSCAATTSRRRDASSCGDRAASASCTCPTARSSAATIRCSWTCAARRGRRRSDIASWIRRNASRTGSFRTPWCSGSARRCVTRSGSASSAVGRAPASWQPASGARSPSCRACAC